MESVIIDGVKIFLSNPANVDMEWIGQEILLEQLLAAWAQIHQDDLPLSPRILGPPGVGKTTLGYAAAKKVNKDVYIFQCTADTRPEDLLINPVIGERQEIKYHASPLVTAMIKGAVCILDEGNRMPEKAWASLAPLLDKRRYIESIIAGIQVKAHPDFRIAVTMNQDASVFDIPDYIGSRLQPKIHVPFPSMKDEINILKYNLPFAPQDILEYVVNFLQKAHANGEPYSLRDGINITRYLLKLSMEEKKPLSKQALREYFVEATVHILGKEALGYLDGNKPRGIKRILGFGNKAFPFDTNILDDGEGVDGDDYNDDGDDYDDDGDDYDDEGDDYDDDGDDYDDDEPTPYSG